MNEFKIVLISRSLRGTGASSAEQNLKAFLREQKAFKRNLITQMQHSPPNRYNGDILNTILNGTAEAKSFEKKLC